MAKILSIVVPAYNMERYLVRCLDSLCVEEAMDSVEIIIVNDGSKDGTLDIAKEYESRFPGYFTVIDKENGNYGSCMNVGLSRAQGKYFRTLDADDWVDSKDYLAFVKDLEYTDADLVLSQRWDYYEKSESKKKVETPFNVSMREDFELTKDSLNVLIESLSVTRMTYRTDVIKLSGLKWDEGVFYSDTEFDYWPLRLVNRIRVVPYAFYIYMIGRNDQSMSITSIKRNFESFFVVSSSILKDFSVHPDYDAVVFEARLRLLKQISRYMYASLLYDGMKNIDRIKIFEDRLKKMPMIYEQFNYIDKYKNHYYVKQFRTCRLFYYTLRVDYIFRTMFKK